MVRYDRYDRCNLRKGVWLMVVIRRDDVVVEVPRYVKLVPLRRFLRDWDLILEILTRSK